jgi:hypothetical protein
MEALWKQQTAADGNRRPIAQRPRRWICGQTRQSAAGGDSQEVQIAISRELPAGGRRGWVKMCKSRIILLNRLVIGMIGAVATS